jgi:hypothetical protein
MGKKKPNKGTAPASQKAVTANYGTHSIDVLKVGEVNINQICEDAFGNHPVVIAKDGEEMYITSNRHVDTGLLDPYKTYFKDNFEIVKNEVEGEDPTYTITNMKNNVTITI